MPDLPTEGDVGDAPLEEFIDPQSGIANILNQMTQSAQRSRPIETIQNANRPVAGPVGTRPGTPTEMGLSPDEFIQMLLSQR